jgi:surface polysaccharide O-acyltransferase-like enzyme
VIYPVQYLLGEKMGMMDWLTRFVTFGNYAWYVEMYIGLFLLSPFLNIILEKLETGKQYLWLLGTMLFMTALPSVTTINLIPDYWTALYPFTMYVIGAGIRRFRPKVPVWLAALGVVATVCLLGLISLLSTDKKFSDGFTQGYGGFWVTLTGTLVFLSLYRLELKGKAADLVKWMAGGCFEGFLLSRLFDVWAYSAMPASWRKPDKYWLLFLAVTVPIFIASILLGKLTHWVSEWLMNRLMPKKKEKTAA